MIYGLFSCVCFLTGLLSFFLQCSLASFVVPFWLSFVLCSAFLFYHNVLTSFGSFLLVFLLPSPAQTKFSHSFLTPSMIFSLASCSAGPDLSCSSVRFPSPYSPEQCIAHEGARHDGRRSISLHNHPRCLSILYNCHSRDTASCAWPKRWKHWSGRGSSNFPVARAEMDIPFVHCVEDESFPPRRVS